MEQVKTKPTPAELIEVHQRRFNGTQETVSEEIEVGPEGETSLELLQSVYRDRTLPLNVRVRCAVEAAPYKNPRVSAVAVTNMTGKSFAEQLERAILRSQSPDVINRPASPAPITIEHSPDEMKKPFARLERFERRF
jgi:hypothetical protein